MLAELMLKCHPSSVAVGFLIKIRSAPRSGPKRIAKPMAVLQRQVSLSSPSHPAPSGLCVPLRRSNSASNSSESRLYYIRLCDRLRDCFERFVAVARNRYYHALV